MGIAGRASAQTAPKVFAPTPPWPPRKHFMLWPGLPPGSPAGATHSNVPVPLPPGTPQRWEMGIRHPYVGVFRAARPNGRAVLVMPGGGYSFVSLINEGVDIANALNALGITVFVLVYRLPGEGWLSRTEAPLQDAQRAMRLIRASCGRIWRRSGEDRHLRLFGRRASGRHAVRGTWGSGVSARQFGRPADRAPRLCRADLSSHPVFERWAQQPIGRQPARPSAAPGAGARFDVVARASAAMPPLFLLHAMDDGTVPYTQSVALMEAARRHRVPAEAHFLERGRHGFGGAGLPATSPGAKWLEWFAAWTATHV